MAKEGNDKKLWKKDIDIEYPKWSQVDYKQDAKFFEDVRKLLVDRLNLKANIINEHVKTFDSVKIVSNVQKFRNTNPLLLKDDRK